MSWYDAPLRIGAGVATGGLSEVGKYGYDKLYKDPATEQKNAYGNAGNSASNLGRSQRDWYMNQGNRALDYFNPSGTPTGGGAPAPLPGGTPVTSTKGLFGPMLSQVKAAQDAQAASAPPAAGGGPAAPGDGMTAGDALGDLKNNRPQQQQTFLDYLQGLNGKQTNQESLYQMRLNGGDPNAAFEDARAVRALNTELAARGGYNSSKGMNRIEDYYANANAQRSHDLGGLAAGADASRLGMTNAYGGASAGASGEQRDYFNDYFHGAFDVSKAKADVLQHYSDNAGQAYSQGEIAKIQADLAAAGVDAATIHQFIGDITSLGVGAGKLATGK